MPQITLYHADGSCSWVPHALLRHLGIPFELIPMKLRPGDNGLEAADGSLSNAEFRKINPAGYVPVLVVDGEVITEQLAVLTMIVLLSPDKEAGEALLGRTPLERVRVTEWMVWLSDTPHSQGYGALLHPKRFVEDHEDMYPVVKAKGKKTIEYCYDIIEKMLDGRTYTVGEHLTVVDFFLYAIWGWGGRYAGIEMGERYPAYGKMLRRVEALDGVRKAMEEEKTKLYFE
ncbi:glutathione S-transferase [Xylariaceae sp. AK1471]|nr:glutathione S-transferase [Xylariaceae sp. AK1471]